MSVLATPINSAKECLFPRVLTKLELLLFLILAKMKEHKK